MSEDIGKNKNLDKSPSGNSGSKLFQLNNTSRISSEIDQTI